MKVLLFIFIFLSSVTIALPYKNVIYISIDGLSRNAMYELLRKDSLPNISQIVDRGNFRNMSLAVKRPHTMQTYHDMLSGYLGEGTIPTGQSIFERLESRIPNLTTGLIMSRPLGELSDTPIDTVLAQAKQSIDIVYPYRFRSSTQVSKDVLRMLEPMQSPFFLFFNFTNVDAMGRTYREGSLKYSLAVKRCDAVIGDIIALLKKNRLWEDTGIVLTTQYGYMLNSQIVSSNVWIASTSKVLRKGTTLDLVPTLISMYGLEYEQFRPKYTGKGLVKR